MANIDPGDRWFRIAAVLLQLAQLGVTIAMR